MTTVLSNPAYDAYMGGTTGAAKDHGETDDPATSGAQYAGTVYYIDSINGNDANSGTSPDHAWKTLAQASTKFNVSYWDMQPPNGSTDIPYHTAWTSAPSGSAFLFMRGGTYTGHIYVSPSNGSGGLQNNYTFGAYGDPTAPRPIILSDSTAAVAANPTEQFTIRDLHFVNASTELSIGMFLNGSNGVKIVNTEVVGYTLDGILADGANNLTIQNSVFYNNANAGYRGGGVTGGGVNTTILNSTFVDNGADQIGSHDAYLRHLTNALIQGNLFVGGSNLGLVIHGSSDGITIRSNEFYGNNNGLSITDSGIGANDVFNNVLVEGNIIHDNGYGLGEQGYGMLFQSLTNSVIQNNLIYGNRLGAVEFDSAYAGNSPSSNVHFDNNFFSGSLHIDSSLTANVSFLNNSFDVSTHSLANTGFQASQLGVPTYAVANFGVGAGGWSSQDAYPRMLADVNGDGLADIVGFGSGGVNVSLATGGGHFAPVTYELNAFGVGAGGWSNQDQYPRLMGDVNGDGKADIVGFGSGGVNVSLATGGGHFAQPTYELNNYGVGAGGWSSDDGYPRLLGDVNGDGMADIVGFGSGGVNVSLATGGGHFAAPTYELAAFGANAGGWTDQNISLRLLGDVNGDGKADIIGFGNGGVSVALATGGGHFAQPTQELDNYGVNAGGWSSQDAYPRQVADINGDGMADIIGFGYGGVSVALATGGGHFAQPTYQLDKYGVGAGGWSSDDLYPRLLGDVTGDHHADIVAFGQGGINVSVAHEGLLIFV